MLIGFFLLWLILCGSVTPEIVIFDAAVSLLVFWFTCRFCRWSIQREMIFWRLLLPGLQYILLLIREIILSNIAMLRLTLRPDFKETCQPVVVRFYAPLRSSVAKMTLANSITLTPGTITVESRKNEFLIHCFNPSYAEDMWNSALVKTLVKMEAIVSVAKEGGF